MWVFHTSRLTIRRSSFSFSLILVMEGLNMDFKVAVGANLLTCVVVGNLGIKNFTLVLCWWCDGTFGLGSTRNREYCLDFKLLLFGVWLKLNINKSNIYGVFVTNEELFDNDTIIGCVPSLWPFIYLGNPIGLSMKLINRWRMVVDRFK